MNMLFIKRKVYEGWVLISNNSANQNVSKRLSSINVTDDRWQQKIMGFLFKFKGNGFMPQTLFF